ncbi:DUF1697 domain-containing protein [Puerhibacterium puerhi]|uniref:DUF1697 domain-containing protein n=1 Tax=Puerhibacterium puerhi TaxID=2692623 RepID=UPI0013595BBD|nr:DUF1697 domain-containing protein [Puerhibacterium puerhi]
MTRYVGLLRGIAPSNPAMRNANLRRVAEGVGLRDVRTVISSGNLVFDADAEAADIEERLEAAWPEQLGFASTSIVRSRAEVERLVAADPFAGLEHGPASYLLVTFLKDPSRAAEPPAAAPDGAAFRLLGAAHGAVFSVTDTTGRAVDVMSWLEKVYGTGISSRTWRTVLRLRDALR